MSSNAQTRAAKIVNLIEHLLVAVVQDEFGDVMTAMRDEVDEPPTATPPRQQIRRDLTALLVEHFDELANGATEDDHA